MKICVMFFRKRTQNFSVCSQIFTNRSHFLDFWPDRQREPAGEEAQAAERGNCTEHFDISDSQHVKTAAEDRDAGGEEDERPARYSRPGGEDEQNDGVHQMVE